MNLLKKLITIILMILAPIVSFKAFYEYANIVYFHHKPSYPFGKELMKSIQTTDISFLSGYQKELLTIGVVFLIISILAYISMLVKAMINLIWLAAISAVLYFVYHKLN